jgi:sterol desaturase/sphingolipid hydroxylase (fatty acid hydroxylase superfamily)
MMKTPSMMILAVYLGFALFELLRTNLFHKKDQTHMDGWVEGISTVALIGFIQPTVLFSSMFLTGQLMPTMEGALAGLHVVLAFGLFLIFDDLTQYLWHRASHSFAWLYKLHRPHHNGEYMSVRVVYRNNLFYYAMMPGLWLSGVLIYLGLGWVYAFYIVMKMTVVISAHSDVCWDRPLLQTKWMSPIMWVVERTISTPATHHAHHGRHKDDGITNYKGNFGNFLFFWDVLFGTAKITRQFPSLYGVENLDPTSLGEQMIWPLVRTSNSVTQQNAKAILAKAV